MFAHSRPQAIWTGSAFLSWVAHGGLASEMTVDRIQRILREGDDVDAIRKVIENHRLMSTRGLAERVRLMGDRGNTSTSETGQPEL